MLLLFQNIQKRRDSNQFLINRIWKQIDSKSINKTTKIIICELNKQIIKRRYSGIIYFLHLVWILYLKEMSFNNFSPKLHSDFINLKKLEAVSHFVCFYTLSSHFIFFCVFQKFFFELFYYHLVLFKYYFNNKLFR